MKFTEADIRDKKYLEEQIREEATRLFKSDKARKNRSFEEIELQVRKGKIAEVYLIETGKYQPSKNIYHDLVDEEGNYVEVKAYTVRDSNAPHVQNDLYRIRTSDWNKSKWYLLFNYDNGTYTFLEKILI